MYWEKLKWITQSWDKYWFVNEVEIRYAAWLSLIFALFSFYLIMIKWNFDLAFFTIWTIFLDFILKVFIDPKYSIFWMIVRPFIKNKPKLMVGAVQKRFAWSIGLILSLFVIYCMLLLSWNLETTNVEVLSKIELLNQNIINGKLFVIPMNPAIIACFLCIFFMFLESVFWICVGCKMYKNLVKKGIIKKIPNQNCVNGSCEV